MMSGTIERARGAPTPTGGPWRLALAALAALVALGAASLLPPRAARAAPPFRAGAVVALAGTPHIFVADEGGVLHWGGDTRGLAGRAIAWGDRHELRASAVRAAARGDPWLSAGLVQIGDAIYLAKWEAAESRPRLLHVQSVADLELFGLHAGNYGAVVLPRADWERRFGFDTDTLPRGELAAAGAAAAAPGAVLLADDFDDADGGVLPKQSAAPEQTQFGYGAGEYFIRDVDPGVGGGRLVVVPGVYADASLAVDVRFVADAPRGYLQLGCRRTAEAPVGRYLARVDPAAGRVKLVRADGAAETVLQDWRPAPTLRRGVERNRVELTCAGTAITLAVNGAPAAAADDATYRAGGFELHVTTFREGTAPAEARFDDLAVTQR